MRATLSACLLPASLLATPLAAQTAPWPDASKGDLTASVDLGAEFPAMQGYVFTQTLFTIAPGTGRAPHSHKDAPEIVRIISGTLTQEPRG